MEPVIFAKIMETMSTLTNAMNVLTDRCVTGIEADRARCAALLDGSLVLATALVPLIGYEAATKLAKIAQAQGITLRDAANRQKISQTVLDAALI